MFEDLSVEEIKRRMDDGEPMRLIDVREPYEHTICHIEGAELRPMSKISEWWHDLDKDEPVVVFCHHGGRSGQVALALAAQGGFTKVGNMAGGIEAWSNNIDASVQRY